MVMDMNTNPTAEDHEIWTSPKGTRCHLVPVAIDLGDWHPESPFERRPQGYELRCVRTGTVVAAPVVTPLEPWSPYDAVSDRARGAGWTRLPHPDDRPYVECEHGLDADLCSGPMHY
jgi:hypothetical protein